MTANIQEALTSAALSFQLMTRAEPPELVIATIKSLLAVMSGPYAGTTSKIV